MHRGSAAGERREAKRSANSMPLSLGERANLVLVHHLHPAAQRAHREARARRVWLRVLVEREKVVAHAGDVVERQRGVAWQRVCEGTQSRRKEGGVRKTREHAAVRQAPTDCDGEERT